MRIFQLVPVLALLGTAARADAQNFDTLPAPGRVMQVNVVIPSAAFFEGRVLRYTEDSLVLKVARAPEAPDTNVVPIPRRAVSMARISTGVELEPYVYSGAIGGAFLATVFVGGVLLERGGNVSRGQVALRTVGIAIGGAIVGGMLGWRSAPPKWLRVDVRPPVQGH
jgi:hypothetical protein